jgi:L-ascorbate metabolism protein UlaG (beta-lactamase superfamily)
MKWWLFRIFAGMVGMVFCLFVAAWWSATPDIGVKAEGKRLHRMTASPQWDGRAFANRLNQVDSSLWQILKKGMEENTSIEQPEEPLPVVKRSGSEFLELPPSGLRVTWLGHSTMLVEIDGVRVLIDPIWGTHASPWSSIGPARFYSPPLPLDELPEVDVIIISHDHYDHLDFETVSRLKDEPVRWIVPLGVGAHLAHWGVSNTRIDELDWWEHTTVKGVTLTATPARHFSGRWVDRFLSTLWAGWAMRGPEHAVFYSGDTGFHPEFKEIGERLGPFDLTMMESGAYSSTWTDVHLGPEQAVIAHKMVGGEVMLPVHWGLFDLAFHGWSDPIERVLAAAERLDVTVVTPRPGASVELSDVYTVDRWWPVTSQNSYKTDPVWSSEVGPLLQSLRILKD